MYNEEMLTFLSLDNIMLHLSFLERLKLKYSILEKSCETLAGKNCHELFKLRIPLEVKDEAVTLRSEIEAHELYFSSFSKNASVCKEIRAYYSSEEAFLYEVLVSAMNSKADFLFVSPDHRGKPTVFTDVTYADICQKNTPCLAVDLCEHSYFLDYGFEREEYLRRAVGHLALSKLIKT